jgi:hypothetical protein
MIIIENKPTASAFPPNFILPLQVYNCFENGKENQNLHSRWYTNEKVLKINLLKLVLSLMICGKLEVSIQPTVSHFDDLMHFTF